MPEVDKAERRGAIEAKNVSKVFQGAAQDRVTALDNVSVTIRENEFFTLLGPSGCGKTTLLRLIAGFDFPTEGEILLYGQDIAPLAALQAAGQHGVPELRAVPAHDGRRRTSASASKCWASRKAEIDARVDADAEARAAWRN